MCVCVCMCTHVHLRITMDTCHSPSVRDLPRALLNAEHDVLTGLGEKAIKPGGAVGRELQKYKYLHTCHHSLVVMGTLWGDQLVEGIQSTQFHFT